MINTDRIKNAMGAAGYYYNDIDSYDGWIVFNGDSFYNGRLCFDSWEDCAEWIAGVIFDDPETNKAIETILNGRAKK